MAKSIVREVIFFVLIFLLFYLATKLGHYWKTKKPQSNDDMVTLVVGAVFTLIMVGIFYLGKLNQHTDSYKLFEISPGAQCQGGAYMNQGSSPRAKMCRELAKTNEGRCAIAAHNCPNGFHGQPANYSHTAFSPNSDSNWQGIGCTKDNLPLPDHNPNCKCGLCSMNTNCYCN